MNKKTPWSIRLQERMPQGEVLLFCSAAGGQQRPNCQSAHRTAAQERMFHCLLLLISEYSFCAAADLPKKRQGHGSLVLKYADYALFSFQRVKRALCSDKNA